MPFYMYFVTKLRCLLNKQNQDCCLLLYHGSRVWTVSINMKVQVQLALMAEDNINTCGIELALRNFKHVCTVDKP